MYTHTQWAMISTVHRCPWYDGGVLPTANPSTAINPKIIPTGQPP